MSTFSPTDAALEGFRVARENPSAIVAWAVIQFVTTAVISIAMISTAGPELAAIMVLVQDKAGAADPKQQIDALSRLGQAMAPAYAVILPLMMMIEAVRSAAVMRVILRPDQRSIGYLRLGGDEFRLLVVVVTKALILAGLTVVATVALVAISAALGTIGVLLGVLGFFALIAGLIFVAVRLSLAVPQSFAERRIAIFDGWSLTASHFWPLMGCYCLAAVLFIVVLLIGSLATGAITAVASIVSGGAMTADYSSLATFFTPLQIVSLALSAIISALGVAVAGSPAAIAYRALTGRGQDAVF